MRTNAPLLLIAAIATAVMLTGTSARADDYYVLEGRAQGGPVLTNIDFLLWSSDVTFFNRGSSAATVRLLGVSNNRPADAVGTEFILPAGRSAALSRLRPGWLFDSPFEPLTVVHIDAPPTVAIESSLYIGTTTSLVFGADPEKFGKTRLPVVRTLAAPGDAQLRLSTDLGSIPGRLNVGVYNAGATPANVTVEVRQFCDDAVIESRAATIAANTVVQLTGFQATQRDCPAPGGIGTLGRPNGAYVIVRADQPSFSFVSALTNADVPTTSISIVGPQP
jgi:hypothetical protein